jgi:glucose/arabinose dehydrogenase
MCRQLPALSIAAAILLFASITGPAQAQVYSAAHHDYRIATFAQGVVQPWSMTWLPSGDMLVTERPGRLRIVRNARLLPDAVAGVPEVFYETDGQGGLFDVVLHPRYDDNRLIYLSYSVDLGDRRTTALARGRFDGNRLNDVEVIFQASAAGARHFGGRLAFDADGYLFLSLGDRQAPPEGDLESHPAQDNSNHSGVMVRLNDDGSVPADNPFADQDGALPEIWSYGHRSPQGLAFHPETGDLWETEHGPQGGDELNRILPGRNYGWPVIGRGVNYGAGNPIHATIMKVGMEQPAHFWVPSIATSGLMIYTGDKFPQWYGDIFAGGLNGQQIAHLILDDDFRSIVREETLAWGLGRVRDIRQGPDGYIYFAIDDRTNALPTAILRLEPAD